MSACQRRKVLSFDQDKAGRPSGNSSAPSTRRLCPLNSWAERVSRSQRRKVLPSDLVRKGRGLHCTLRANEDETTPNMARFLVRQLLSERDAVQKPMPKGFSTVAGPFCVPLCVPEAGLVSSGHLRRPGEWSLGIEHPVGFPGRRKVTPQRRRLMPVTVG